MSCNLIDCESILLEAISRAFLNLNLLQPNGYLPKPQNPHSKCILIWLTQQSDEYHFNQRLFKAVLFKLL